MGRSAAHVVHAKALCVDLDHLNRHAVALECPDVHPTRHVPPPVLVSAVVVLDLTLRPLVIVVVSQPKEPRYRRLSAPNNRWLMIAAWQSCMHTAHTVLYVPNVELLLNARVVVALDAVTVRCVRHLPPYHAGTLGRHCRLGRDTHA